jgi:hypothetical protein
MGFTLPTTDLVEPTVAPFLEGSGITAPPLTNTQRRLRDQLQSAFAEPLTNKQRMFVSALFGNGFNQLKAAKEADPSLSNAAAARKGKYWYSLPQVQHAIEVAYTYFDEAQKVRFEDIIGELRVIAFSNIMDFHSIDPKTKDPILTLPDDPDDPRLKAISEISTEDTKFGVKSKIRVHDKLNAIEKLLKILDPAKNDPDKNVGAAVTIQNINIIPVPTGQFIPAPKFEAKPLLELTRIPAKPLLTNKS